MDERLEWAADRFRWLRFSRHRRGRTVPVRRFAFGRCRGIRFWVTALLVRTVPVYEHVRRSRACGPGRPSRLRWPHRSGGPHGFSGPHRRAHGRLRTGRVPGSPSAGTARARTRTAHARATRTLTARATRTLTARGTRTLTARGTRTLTARGTRCQTSGTGRASAAVPAAG